MYTYEFKEVFEFASHGADQEVESITMRAPTAKEAAFGGAIEFEINKAVMSLAEKFKGQEESVVKKEEVPESENERIDGMVTMIQASGVNVVKCYGHLKQCVIQTKASFNDEIPCTTVNYDNIPLKELTRFLGWYIVNFINTSF